MHEESGRGSGSHFGYIGPFFKDKLTKMERELERKSLDLAVEKKRSTSLQVSLVVVYFICRDKGAVMRPSLVKIHKAIFSAKFL